MGTRRLIRDRLEGTDIVDSNAEYKELLFGGIIERYQELYLIPNGKHKKRAYELIGDIVELSNCINNQYLMAKTEVATISRHTACMKRAKEMAETEGGFFNGVVMKEQAVKGDK